jgi:DNA polymerase
LGWPELEVRVSACTRCALHAGRSRTVFGVGNRQADWLVVGEAPGAEEDRRGEPFVGRAGKLLDAMLAALGHERRDVYIANVVKCRPPENRDPQPEEADRCAPYLDRQIELLQPRIILAVGRVAAQRLLGTETPVGRLRGQVYRHDPSGIPLVVTWHPAYLLRRPEAKAEAWRDLVLAASAAATGRP